MQSEIQPLSVREPRQVGEDHSNIPVISEPLTPSDLLSGLFLLTENDDECLDSSKN